MACHHSLHTHGSHDLICIRGAAMAMVTTRARAKTSDEPNKEDRKGQPNTRKASASDLISDRYATALIIATAIVLRLLVGLHPYSGDTRDAGLLLKASWLLACGVMTFCFCFRRRRCTEIWRL